MSISPPHLLPRKDGPQTFSPAPPLDSSPQSNLERLKQRLSGIRRPTDPVPPEEAHQHGPPRRDLARPSPPLPEAGHTPPAAATTRQNPNRKRYQPLRALLAIGSGFLILAMLAAVTFSMGYEIGKSHALPPHPQAPRQHFTRLEPSEIAALESAARMISAGSPKTALRELDDLRKSHPTLPFVDYLGALAALNDENFPLALRLAQASAEKGERVSDALALQAAALDGSSAEGPVLGDPTLTRQSLLEEAIAADPLNPRARLDLAAVLRKRGEHDKALAHLRIARLAATPVDSLLAIETTLALTEAEAGARPQTPPGSIVEIFVRAQDEAAQRRPAEAAKLLRGARSLLPGTTWDFLISDPVFRRYGLNPALETP